MPARPFGGLQRLALGLAGAQRRAGLDAQVLGIYDDQASRRHAAAWDVPFQYTEGTRPGLLSAAQLLSALAATAPDCLHPRRAAVEQPPGETKEQRQRIGDAAVAACKKLGYSSSGTVEFLLDASGQFYFMEMNTRIQVEHPVTEMVTLADIVRNQIRIAEGEPLGYTQDDLLIVGHAIECRINAENPETFAPSPGVITAFNLPGGPGVRVDTFVYSGYRVSPFYDSLIAKVIVHARTRDLAIARMKRALEAMVIEGIKTTIPLHLKIMDDPRFRAGDISTNFMEYFLARNGRKVAVEEVAGAGAKARA